MEGRFHGENERLRQEIQALRQQLAEALEQIEALRQRNAELKALLVQAQRAKRRQAAPFGRKKRKSRPKKPGRKKGHRGSRRKPPKHVDQTLSAPRLEDCPDCQAPLTDLKSLENYQTEIPPIQPEVTRFVFASGWCECCQKRVFSRHPEQISIAIGAAAHHLGPRLRALAADLKCRLGIPFRKIQEILEQSFGVQVSPGALVLSNDRLADQAEATLEAMKEQLSAEALVHVDETGWRVDAHNAWLWVICTQQLTIYLIAPHRQATVVEEVLGEAFEGFLVRDGWASYDARLAYSMLRCLRHLQHNAEDLETQHSEGALALPGLLSLWIEGVFSLKKRADELCEEAYVHEAAELVAWFDEFVQDESSIEPYQRFLQRLAELRDQIVPILEQPQLPATNNLAERQIRPMVVHRKIAAGNKTEFGAATLSTLASLTASCRQQAVSFADVAARILRQPSGQPVEFWLSDLDPSPS